MVREEENGFVTFAPAYEWERIWAGVMYLYGIDAMKAPNVYLHSSDGIREAMTANSMATAKRWRSRSQPRPLIEPLGCVRTTVCEIPRL
jgi:hypothetical protein